MRNRIKTWGPRLIVAVTAAWLLFELVVAVGMFFDHDWRAIQFPYPLDYGEGPLLDQTMRLSRLENIYKHDLSNPPYTISNYPPLFLLLQVPFAWLFGPALWYGRAINVISLVVAAVFIGLTVYAMTNDRLAGLVGGLVLLTFPYIMHWSAFNRIDSLALGISCVGLYVTVRWGHSRRGVIGAAVLFVAAVYTRQSYLLAAPLAAFVWLLRKLPDEPYPPRRRAFELAAWVAGLGLALVGLLNLLTRGGFYFNIVTSNVNPFYWDTVGRYVREVSQNLPFLLIGSAALLLFGVWLRFKPWWLVGPYLVGAVISGVAIGKSGSNVNYLFELCVAFSLVSGVLAAWLGRRWWSRALLFLILAVQVSMVVRWSKKEYYGRIGGKIARTDEIERMMKYVQEADDAVLGDEYMGLIPLAGRALYFQPFEMKQLYLAGIWDEWSFIKDIERKKFSVILMFEPPWWNSRRERWTEAATFYIEMYYERADKLADTVIYLPAP